MAHLQFPTLVIGNSAFFRHVSLDIGHFLRRSAAMAHDHCHSEDAQTYYIDQLCTIALCGTFGAVAFMLGYQKSPSGVTILDLLLVPWMHIYVMIGGVAMVVLAVIRG